MFEIWGQNWSIDYLEIHCFCLKPKDLLLATNLLDPNKCQIDWRNGFIYFGSVGQTISCVTLEDKSFCNWKENNFIWAKSL